MDNFTESQYKEIWDMIFSQTGYPPNHPKHETKAPKEEQVPMPIKVEGSIRMAVTHAMNMKAGGMGNIRRYDFYTSQPIPESKYQSIKEAIERELNGVSSPKVEIGDLESFNRGYSMGYKDANKYNDKKYTESEILHARKDAFDESRKTNPLVGFKHDNFQDYINSLK